MIIFDNIQFYPTVYEGYYVSKCGKVISFRTRGQSFKLSKNPKYLSFKTDKYGYYEVLLSINKKRYYKKVHQLVAETFLEKEFSEYVVDHIDTNRKNNNLSNLRYLTVSENARRGRAGVKPAIAKKVEITLDGVTNIYYSIKDAMKAINISPCTFYRMKNNEIGSRFKYKIVSLNEGVETIEITLETKVRE